MARELTFDDPGKAAQHAAVDFPAMAAAVAAARALCDRTDSPVVFCHNDLLSGNILLMNVLPEEPLDALPPERLQVQLIDFEYGAQSFRGFDLGALWVWFSSLALISVRFRFGSLYWL